MPSVSRERGRTLQDQSSIVASNTIEVGGGKTDRWNDGLAPDDAADMRRAAEGKWNIPPQSHPLPCMLLRAASQMPSAYQDVCDRPVRQRACRPLTTGSLCTAASNIDVQRFPHAPHSLRLVVADRDQPPVTMYGV